MGSEMCIRDRYHVVRRPRTYIRRMTEGSENRLDYPLTPAVAGSEDIDLADEMADTIIMGLRLLKEGLSANRFAHRFGQTLDQVHGETIQELVDLELLTWHDLNGDRTLHLTEKGRFISNQVFHRFI